MNCPCRSYFVALVALLVCAGPAAAQRATGPYAGLFGGDEDAANRAQALDLRASLFGALDDVLTTADHPGLDERFLRSGFAGGANGSLVYARRSDRTRLQASAGSTFRMFAASSDAAAATFATRSAFEANMSSRVSFAGSGGWAYTPYYQFAPGVDTGIPDARSTSEGFGVASAAERNTTADAAAGVTVRVSRRARVTAEGRVSEATFLDRPASNLTFWGARATLRQAITRTVGVHLGYGREEATYRIADVARVANDTIDVGLDYGDTLSFSRRTALSFASSTSMVRYGDERLYRLNGSATLTRAFRRTGSIGARYARDTEFAAGFRAPLLTDRFSVAIGEQVGRRARWVSGAGVMRGTIGVSEDAPTFNTYSAGARLMVAVTRRLGVYGEYMYYRYEVPGGSTAFDFLPMFSRQGVTAGLTLWAPIINVRSPRDPR